jgi:hypothetical protein
MDPAEVSTLVETLETEVSNGGFDAFFFNSTGDHTAETIAALDAIGAPKTAAIVRRAAGSFPGGMPSKERTERQRLLERRSGPVHFAELDNQFCQYPEDLGALLKRFAEAASKSAG